MSTKRGKKLAVYVAAPFGRSDTAEKVADTLTGKGYRVVSTWHKGAPGKESADIDVLRAAIEQNDSDLAKCDVVFAIAYDGEGGEMFCEIANALAAGKRVVYCGGRTVLSAYRDGVVRVWDVIDGYDSLDRIRNGLNVPQ